MTQSAADLRRIAHDALSLTEAPYLKHYKGGRFKTWNGVALTAISSLPGPGFSFAACLGPTPTLDDILPVAREFFADCEQGWGVLVEADAGHPVEAELKARGWAVAEDEPAYVMEGIETAGTNPAARPELVIRRARTPEDAAAFQRVTAVAFNAPPEFADSMIPSPAYVLDPDIGLLIGSLDGQDVSAAGFSKSGPTAVVWGTATLEAYRGRGYGAALVRAALAEATARGCTSAALRSGPLSRPLYERLGFQYTCNHRTYAAPAVT